MPERALAFGSKGCLFSSYKTTWEDKIDLLVELFILSLPEICNCCLIYDAQNSEIHAFYESEMVLDVGNLRKRLSKKLPIYMLPNKFHFFKKLPMTSNGKIDRARLKFLIKENA